MPVDLPTPISVPAATYDKLWLKNLTIVYPDINGKVSAYYLSAAYREIDSTTSEGGPEFGNQVIGDLYATAAERAGAGKPALANAIGALLTALLEIETDRGAFGGGG